MNKEIDHKFQTIIAIDPDVDRNGIARLDIGTKLLEIKALSFPETLHYLKNYASAHNDFEVLIEAGWLNQSNWHLARFCSKAQAAETGNRVGRNHEIGRKIAEMCEYWNIPYRLIKPLKKDWHGKDGKITATELESFTGYKGRTNQEGRDAALISWVAAKLPIKIPKRR